MTTSQCFPSAEIISFSCFRGQGACSNDRKFILHLKYEIFPMLAKKLVLNNDAFLIALMLFSNGFNANKGVPMYVIIDTKSVVRQRFPCCSLQARILRVGVGGFA